MSNTSLRDRLKEKSVDSDTGKFPKYVTPIIKFNGNSGAFTYRGIVNGELSREDVAIASPKFIILKRRSTLYSPMGVGAEVFTSEFSSPSDEISVFQKTDSGVQFVKATSVTNARGEFPALKTKLVLYVLFEGQVTRFEVKGMSLSEFFNMQKRLDEEDKHLFEVSITVTSTKLKNEKTKSAYYAMQFATEEVSDAELELIEAPLDEVNEAIERQVKYQLNKNQTPTAGFAVTSKDVVDFDNYENGKEEIPF